jgi:hypothetical protein
MKTLDCAGPTDAVSRLQREAREARRWDRGQGVRTTRCDERERMMKVLGYGRRAA